MSFARACCTPRIQLSVFFISIGWYMYSQCDILASLNLLGLSVFDIGPSSFQNTKKFELNGLSNLQTIAIGDESFNEAMEEEEEEDLSFQIENCSKIDSITIFNSCFIFYRSFTIRNCSMLSSIIIGNLESFSSSFYMSDIYIEGNNFRSISCRSTFIARVTTGWRIVLSSKQNIVAKQILSYLPRVDLLDLSSLFFGVNALYGSYNKDCVLTMKSNQEGWG